MARGLGLHRPELRAWAMYDWANSVFMTTIILTFPIYFAAVASVGSTPAQATERFALATTLSMAIVALLAPVLGTLADHAGTKKKMLFAFLVLGTTCTALLALVGEGEWKLGAVLFILANIGVTGSLVFHESLLPHIAREDELDAVCTASYALGYLGGGLLLAVNLFWIQKPALFGIPDAATAMRLSFLSAALWWAGFSIPLFLSVAEPPGDPRRDGVERNVVALAVHRLSRTFREMRAFRDAFLFLLAFMLYNDGIMTIIRMAPVYGTEIGIPRGSLITAFVMVQFVGVPFSFLFGALARRVGARPAIYLALSTYVAIALVAYRMESARDFYVLAFLVGMVQGGAQALSRSVFARLVPRHKSSELFAFFSVFEKFAGIFGPLIFALTIRGTGSSRGAVLSLVAFFVLGGLLLSRVDIGRGEAAARLAEASAA